MERQVEYQLNAQEIRDAILEYVSNIRGDIDVTVATCHISGNGINQDEFSAIIRSK